MNVIQHILVPPFIALLMQIARDGLCFSTTVTVALVQPLPNTFTKESNA